MHVDDGGIELLPCSRRRWYRAIAGNVDDGDIEL